MKNLFILSIGFVLGLLSVTLFWFWMLSQEYITTFEIVKVSVFSLSALGVLLGWLYNVWDRHRVYQLDITSKTSSNIDTISEKMHSSVVGATNLLNNLYQFLLTYNEKEESRKNEITSFLNSLYFDSDNRDMIIVDYEICHNLEIKLKNNLLNEKYLKDTYSWELSRLVDALVLYEAFRINLLKTIPSSNPIDQANYFNFDFLERIEKWNKLNLYNKIEYFLFFVLYVLKKHSPIGIKEEDFFDYIIDMKPGFFKYYALKTFLREYLKKIDYLQQILPQETIEHLS